MKKIVDDVEYLRDMFTGLCGDRDGLVDIDKMINWLEKDDCNNVYILEHIIAVVKLKNGLK